LEFRVLWSGVKPGEVNEDVDAIIPDLLRDSLVQGLGFGVWGLGVIVSS